MRVPQKTTKPKGNNSVKYEVDSRVDMHLLAKRHRRHKQKKSFQESFYATSKQELITTQTFKISSIPVNKSSLDNEFDLTLNLNNTIGSDMAIFMMGASLSSKTIQTPADANGYSYTEQDRQNHIEQVNTILGNNEESQKVKGLREGLVEGARRYNAASDTDKPDIKTQVEQITEIIQNRSSQISNATKASVSTEYFNTMLGSHTLYPNLMNVVSSTTKDSWANGNALREYVFWDSVTFSNIINQGGNTISAYEIISILPTEGRTLTYKQGDSIDTYQTQNGDLLVIISSASHGDYPSDDILLVVKPSSSLYSFLRSEFYSPQEAYQSKIYLNISFVKAYIPVLSTGSNNANCEQLIPRTSTTTPPSSLNGDLYSSLTFGDCSINDALYRKVILIGDNNNQIIDFPYHVGVIHLPINYYNYNNQYPYYISERNNGFWANGEHNPSKLWNSITTGKTSSGLFLAPTNTSDKTIVPIILKFNSTRAGDGGPGNYASGFSIDAAGGNPNSYNWSDNWVSFKSVNTITFETENQTTQNPSGSTENPFTQGEAESIIAGAIGLYENPVVFSSLGHTFSCTSLSMNGIIMTVELMNNVTYHLPCVMDNDNRLIQYDITIFGKNGKIWVSLLNTGDGASFGYGKSYTLTPLCSNPAYFKTNVYNYQGPLVPNETPVTFNALPYDVSTYTPAGIRQAFNRQTIWKGKTVFDTNNWLGQSNGTSKIAFSNTLVVSQNTLLFKSYLYWKTYNLLNNDDQFNLFLDVSNGNVEGSIANSPYSEAKYVVEIKNGGVIMTNDTVLLYPYNNYCINSITSSRPYDTSNIQGNNIMTATNTSSQFPCIPIPVSAIQNITGSASNNLSQDEKVILVQQTRTFVLKSFNVFYQENQANIQMNTPEFGYKNTVFNYGNGPTSCTLNFNDWSITIPDTSPLFFLLFDGIDFDNINDGGEVDMPNFGITILSFYPVPASMTFGLPNSSNNSNLVSFDTQNVCNAIDTNLQTSASSAICLTTTTFTNFSNSNWNYMSNGQNGFSLSLYNCHPSVLNCPLSSQSFSDIDNRYVKLVIAKEIYSNNVWNGTNHVASKNASSFTINSGTPKIMCIRDFSTIAPSIIGLICQLSVCELNREIDSVLYPYFWNNFAQVYFWRMRWYDLLFGCTGKLWIGSNVFSSEQQSNGSVWPSAWPNMDYVGYNASENSEVNEAIVAGKSGDWIKTYFMQNDNGGGNMAVSCIPLSRKGNNTNSNYVLNTLVVSMGGGDDILGSGTDGVQIKKPGPIKVLNIASMSDDQLAQLNFCLSENYNSTYFNRSSDGYWLGYDHVANIIDSNNPPDYPYAWFCGQICCNANGSFESTVSNNYVNSFMQNVFCSSVGQLTMMSIGRAFIGSWALGGVVSTGSAIGVIMPDYIQRNAISNFTNTKMKMSARPDISRMNNALPISSLKFINAVKAGDTAIWNTLSNSGPPNSSIYDYLNNVTNSNDLRVSFALSQTGENALWGTGVALAHIIAPFLRGYFKVVVWPWLRGGTVMSDTADFFINIATSIYRYVAKIPTAISNSFSDSFISQFIEAVSEDGLKIALQELWSAMLDRFFATETAAEAFEASAVMIGLFE